MADALDEAGYDFISRQPTALKSQSNFNHISFGGKAKKTKVPKRAVQAIDYTYISDEPERFIEYIKDIKKDFVTEKDAIKLIKEKWKHDSSLKNMIDKLSEKGVLNRELGSLVQTKQVQGWFKYRLIAKRMGMKTKVLRKYEKATNPSMLQELLEKFVADKKAKVNREQLFYKTKSGTIKGREVVGELIFTHFKYTTKKGNVRERVVPRYRDPKTKQFIKI